MQCSIITDPPPGGGHPPHRGGVQPPLLCQTDPGECTFRVTFPAKIDQKCANQGPPLGWYIHGGGYPPPRGGVLTPPGVVNYPPPDSKPTPCYSLLLCLPSDPGVTLIFVPFNTKLQKNILIIHLKHTNFGLGLRITKSRPIYRRSSPDRGQFFGKSSKMTNLLSFSQ